MAYGQTRHRSAPPRQTSSGPEPLRPGVPVKSVLGRPSPSLAKAGLILAMLSATSAPQIMIFIVSLRPGPLLGRVPSVDGK